MKAIWRKIYSRLYQNESGQAVIEYVLVMMVSVAIVLGALYQLNDAFRIWADSYFGDYLACLLETGELPALDGGGGTCGASYSDFKLDKGRQLVNGGDGSSSSSGENGGNGGSGNSAASGAAARAAANGQSNIISMGNSRSSFRGSTRFSARSSAGGDEDSKKGGDSDTGSFGATNLSGYQQGRVIRIPLRQSEQIARGRRGSDDDDKKDKTKIKVAATVQGAAQQRRAELMRIERKIASGKAPEIEEFTFGNFLRYIIIAAIIIAILFFIGGQAMQVSKSLD